MIKIIPRKDLEKINKWLENGKVSQTPQQGDNCRDKNLLEWRWF
jgi:transcriptional antiterminator